MYRKGSYLLRFGGNLILYWAQPKLKLWRIFTQHIYTSKAHTQLHEHKTRRQASRAPSYTDISQHATLSDVGPDRRRAGATQNGFFTISTVNLGYEYLQALGEWNSSKKASTWRHPSMTDIHRLADHTDTFLDNSFLLTGKILCAVSKISQLPSRLLQQNVHNYLHLRIS